MAKKRKPGRPSPPQDHNYFGGAAKPPLEDEKDENLASDDEDDIDDEEEEDNLDDEGDDWGEEPQEEVRATAKAKKPSVSLGQKRARSPAPSGRSWQQPVSQRKPSAHLSTRPGHAPTVTQAELRRMVRLREMADTLAQARKDIVSRLEAGARVERGPLTAHVKTQSTCNSSWKRLRELLGDEIVEEPRAQTKPTVCKMLKIREVE